jgi:hypothetical protein
MAKKKKGMDWCCCGGLSGKFPTFASAVLVLGILWILSELKILTVEVPWFPVILVVVAIGWIVDFYAKKK